MKCDCGKEIEINDFEDMGTEDGLLEVNCIANCECGLSYTVTELFKVDWKNPYDVIVERQ